MIRTHPSSRTRQPLVAMFALTATPTAWTFAGAGFGRGLQRHAVSLLWLLVCVAGLNPAPALSQGIITTVAGNGTRGTPEDDIGDPSVTLNLGEFTSGVAVDAAGNLYIADSNNHRIRKVNPSGRISTVAGIVIWDPPCFVWWYELTQRVKSESAFQKFSRDSPYYGKVIRRVTF